MSNLTNRLLNAVSSIQNTDSELADELHELRKDDNFKKKARDLEGIIAFPPNDTVNEVMGPGGIEPDLALETIVLKTGRPVLTISHNEAILQFSDAESQVWKERLETSKQQLISAARAVGRIELENDPSYQWVGTGWLINESIVVTNRHVAQVFGKKNGAGFVFRQGLGGLKVNASIDFLEEANRPEDLTFKVEKILHIEEEEGPDMALLRVQLSTKNGLARPIALSSILPVERQQVAVIGYPARDSRIPDQQLMLNIFGDVYDKKRLAPGQIKGSSVKQILHDCSTLGGNSGSAVIDLKSGKAVGLHFAGKFLENNFAVPAAIIKDRLDRITKNSHPALPPSPKNEVSPGNDDSPASLPSGYNQNVATFTVPLHISISVGTPITRGILGNFNSVPVNNIPDNSQVIDDGEREEFITEGVPEDYNDRKGYTESFLGNNSIVPLPKIVKQKMKKDILSFKINGENEMVLKYQHFSVVMSASRRLCFFSAVNIDGNTSVPMKRGPWRLDPRIPANAQIMKECYGNAPKFSRGHMTRREDPIWGEDEDAAQGNADSMHVTNTVPQMQGMNAGIWLKLENYALQNARKDDMRISVFTGPVFKTGDPIKFGVSVPVSFWKVIAFVHDETKKLCATGYRISQEEFLQEEEFVFGAHETAQVSIASIEKATGLSFEDLTGLDPFEKDTEAPIGPEGPAQIIKSFDQIKFV